MYGTFPLGLGDRDLGNVEMPLRRVLKSPTADDALGRYAGRTDADLEFARVSAEDVADHLEEEAVLLSKESRRCASLGVLNVEEEAIAIRQVVVAEVIGPLLV